MAKMRACRSPFKDSRDGRLKMQVRWAFRLSRGEPLTTTDLLKHCYGPVFLLDGKKFKSWHRANVLRTADLLATRIGRATSQGRPIVWSPTPELMASRLAVGTRRGRSGLQSLSWRELRKLLGLIAPRH